jgi:hypothetical protein
MMLVPFNPKNGSVPVPKNKQQSKKKQTKIVKKSPPQKVSKAIPKMVADFARSLKFPFSPSSIGCRVPDPWSFPTQTYHLHGTFVLSSSAFGSGTVSFYPNPILSAVDWSGGAPGISGSAFATTPGNPLTLSVAASGTGFCQYIQGATSLANLQSVLSDYRVVAWGIKISNLQAELNATGRIIVSCVPVGDEVPDIDVLTGGPAVIQQGGMAQRLAGLPASVITSSTMLELPSAFELSVQDLLHGDVEIVGQYTSPSFFTLKSTGTSHGQQIMAGYFDSDALTAVASTGAPSPGGYGYKDPTRMVGGCGIYIYYEGMQFSVNCLQVEYIYHLEGSPAIGSSSNVTPIASVQPQPVVGTTEMVEKAMSVTTGEKCINFISQGLEFANNLNNSVKKSTGQGILQWAGEALAFL